MLRGDPTVAFTDISTREIAFYLRKWASPKIWGEKYVEKESICLSSSFINEKTHYNQHLYLQTSTPDFHEKQMVFYLLPIGLFRPLSKRLIECILNLRYPKPIFAKEAYWKCTPAYFSTYGLQCVISELQAMYRQLKWLSEKWEEKRHYEIKNCFIDVKRKIWKLKERKKIDEHVLFHGILSRNQLIAYLLLKRAILSHISFIWQKP